MFGFIGDWVHWLVTGEEDGGRSPVESTEPSPKKGFFGFLGRVVETAFWIAQETAHLLNKAIEVVNLSRAVKVAAVALLAPGPAKLVLVS